MTEPITIFPQGSLKTWWDFYEDGLARGPMAQESLEALSFDSDFIVQEGILAAGSSTGTWPSSRIRAGAVIGSVQSGKTASMLGVSAKCLDNGIDIVILLSGTRTALWKQTFQRLVSQLDNPELGPLRRVLVPNPKRPMNRPSQDLKQLYSLSSGAARTALEQKRPIIFTAMKQVAHLENLAKILHDRVFPEIAKMDRPVHLLVIDDEADDASIDDDGEHESLDYAQIPRRIIDLWEERSSRGETAVDNLFATYVGYTATPQANFLLDQRNLLYPRDFVFSLRTPYDRGTLIDRTANYWSSGGLPSWYTGGEVFYKRFAHVPLCMTPTDTKFDPGSDGTTEANTFDSIRAFLVASALKLLRSPGKISPVAGIGLEFPTSELASNAFLSPSTMLIHPSARTSRHFEIRASVLNWSRGSNEDAAGEHNFLGSKGIVLDMEAHEDRWLFWIDNYAASKLAVEKDTGHIFSPFTIDSSNWPLVKHLVLEQIIPATKVAVINSNDASDDRPIFDPIQDPQTGHWRQAPDSSTIFVSGSVMSRGLTLEGLLTTDFARESSVPLADTQMQMQRWLGYRGANLDLCRVFTSVSQRKLFIDYHEKDEATRDIILARMNNRSDGSERIPTYHGPTYLPTGKIKDIGTTSLDPGAKPFFRLVNGSGNDDNNQRLVTELFANNPVHEIKSENRPGELRGVLINRQFTVLEVADLLDSWELAGSENGALSSLEASWTQIARFAKIPKGDETYPLYRGKRAERLGELGLVSPHRIAAYLRLWHACSLRSAVGFTTTHATPITWSLMPREARLRSVPKFNIGLRFGSGTYLSEGPLSDLPYPARTMIRDGADKGVLAATWGSRGHGTAIADERFDQHIWPEEILEDVNGRRCAGAPGLLLFHLIEVGEGIGSLAFGTAIPAGGPNIMKASRR